MEEDKKSKSKNNKNPTDKNKKGSKKSKDDIPFTSKKWIILTEDELKKWYEGKEAELIQLVKMARAYQEIAHLPNCNNCGMSPYCEARPPIGNYVRFNCFAWEPLDDNDFYYGGGDF